MGQILFCSDLALLLLTRFFVKRGLTQRLSFDNISDVIEVSAGSDMSRALPAHDS